MTRVLVIDDDVDLIWDLAAVRPAGVELVTAANTAAAAEALRKQRIDAIVLDLRLPASLATKDADEGLALLGGITGAFRGRIPVVVATDSDDPDLVMWCGRLGAERVLSKSCGLSAIIQAAVDLVQGNHAHAAGSRAGGRPAGARGGTHAAS